MEIVTNWNVYNLDNALKASKYPMAKNVSELNDDITDTIKKLGRADRGTGHDNYLHGILVAFDLTCSNKMWIEFERYHFADIVSSQSTMHKINHLLEQNPFNEYVVPIIKSAIELIWEEYKNNPTPESYLTLLYNIPSGIKLTAHIVTNYGQLKTIWHQRHNHRLPEWREFCDWILTLPKFKELTGIGDEENGKN